MHAHAGSYIINDQMNATWRTMMAHVRWFSACYGILGLMHMKIYAFFLLILNIRLRDGTIWVCCCGDWVNARSGYRSMTDMCHCIDSFIVFMSVVATLNPRPKDFGSLDNHWASMENIVLLIVHTSSAIFFGLDLSTSSNSFFSNLEWSFSSSYLDSEGTSESSSWDWCQDMLCSIRINGGCMGCGWWPIP